MWIHTRPRSEYEHGILLNLDQASRINVNHLGEKWFVEATIGTDAFPLASTTSEDEAIEIVRRILTSLSEGRTALDLSGDGIEARPRTEPGPPGEDQK